MNGLLSFIIVIAFIFSGETEGDIGFRYGFLSKPSYESNDITALSDSSIIHTGDWLKINIGYSNKTNFCILYKDASDEYIPLYSSDDKEDSNQDTIYVPGLHWAEMENPPGIETFYFINTTESLSELNSLLARYENAPSKGRAKLSVRIQAMVDLYDPDVQDDLSSISSDLDKPVSGGVAFRGDEEDGKIKDLHLTHECAGSRDVAFQKIELIHQPKR